MKFILKRSVKLFQRQEIADKDFRYTYHDAYERIYKLTNAIVESGWEARIKLLL